MYIYYIYIYINIYGIQKKKLNLYIYYIYKLYIYKYIYMYIYIHIYICVCVCVRVCTIIYCTALWGNWTNWTMVGSFALFAVNQHFRAIRHITSQWLNEKKLNVNLRQVFQSISKCKDIAIPNIDDGAFLSFIIVFSFSRLCLRPWYVFFLSRIFGYWMQVANH